MAKVSHLVLPVTDLDKSRDWYVDKLGFSLERQLEKAVGIKDNSGLTLFLQRAATAAGTRITLTIQVENVEATYRELSDIGIEFVSPPKLQFWGYGAEVLDPDGYMNHLWDEASMTRAMGEMGKRP